MVTNPLILPRCQTHCQAISLSQLVKVPDNLHAPFSSLMLSSAHAGQKVWQQRPHLRGDPDTFGLPEKLITTT